MGMRINTTGKITGRKFTGIVSFFRPVDCQMLHYV
jgi:hypothetical protein